MAKKTKVGKVKVSCVEADLSKHKKFDDDAIARFCSSILQLMCN